MLLSDSNFFANGAGNGDCKCGTCDCYTGFEGSACQCRKSEEACRTSDNTVCYGRGSCVCNRCVCKEGYQPPYCKTCLGCPDPCQTKLNCIECLGFGNGPFEKNCSTECKNTMVKKVDQFTLTTKECQRNDSEGCWIKFKLDQLVGEDNYRAEVLEQRECPPSVAVIIGGFIAGVALIGILVLMLIKVLLYMKNLKELKKLENERKKSEWREDYDPILHTATTNMANPTFTGE